MTRRPLAYSAVLAVLSAAAVTAAPATASAAKIYGPHGTHSAGLELALVDDAWADDGLGVGGHYEMVLVRSAGPGHVMGGGSALVAFTDDEFRGCDREETILTGAARVRYVLGVSNVVKPYAGIGLGLYGVNREYEDCGPGDDLDGDDTDIGIGIPVSIGLDFAFDAFTFGVSFNFHETSAGDDDDDVGGDEDFNHVGLGVSWRF